VARFISSGSEPSIIMVGVLIFFASLVAFRSNNPYSPGSCLVFSCMISSSLAYVSVLSFTASLCLAGFFVYTPSMSVALIMRSALIFCANCTVR